MAADTKKMLDLANKLIFVKRYDQAAKVLDDILADEQGKDDLLVHLRRIELAARLDDGPSLRQRYLDAGHRARLSPVTAELCLAMVEQHTEAASPSQAVAKYRDIMERHGESAAAYYGIGFGLECQGNFERAIYNYKQSLRKDPHWYPAYFGLSQIFYQQHDEGQGEHYFYLFEKHAPFNLYGNFETHKSLAYEFLEAGKYEEAQMAIASLSAWWQENKSACPSEVRIYEHFLLAKIAEQRGDDLEYRRCTVEALQQTDKALKDASLTEGALYFIAKTLEDFSHFQLAFKVYKKIIKSAGGNQAVIQRVGGQFLALGEYGLAKELFDEAYRSFPDSSEVRFCRLITDLKQAGADVEEYVASKEKLRGLLDNQGDKVEIMSLLHNLMSRFQDDPDVHLYMADVYHLLGNMERAARHYEKMFKLDSLSRRSALKYAAFLLQKGDRERAWEILNEIQIDESDDQDLYLEHLWLRSHYHFKQGEFQASLELIRKIIKVDPWNVSYLVCEVICLTKLKFPDQFQLIDKGLHVLSGQQEEEVDWVSFIRLTDFFVRESEHEIAYARSKLSFLYDGSSDEAFRRLIKSAGHHDSKQGCSDFLRLLNTNFDSPLVYLGLGLLSKDLWQLETACMWLEQIVERDAASALLKGEAYEEIADSYLWRNVHYAKAVEYIKIASELRGETSRRSQVILSHAYLRLGEIRKAQMQLDKLDGGPSDFETSYLQGLLHYRNGQVKKAKDVWKPMLSLRSENIRYHHIKQEMLKFYFEGEAYLKAT